MLVLSEAVLVIEQDGKIRVNGFEHEHRRKRLSTSTSTSTTCPSAVNTDATIADEKTAGA